MPPIAYSSAFLLLLQASDCRSLCLSASLPPLNADSDASFLLLPPLIADSDASDPYSKASDADSFEFDAESVDSDADTNSIDSDADAASSGAAIIKWGLAAHRSAV